MIRMWESPPCTVYLEWLIDGWLIDWLSEWVSEWEGCPAYRMFVITRCHSYRVAMVRIDLGLWMKSQPDWHGYRFSSLVFSIVTVENFFLCVWSNTPVSVVTTECGLCMTTDGWFFVAMKTKWLSGLVNVLSPNGSTPLVTMFLGLCVWREGFFSVVAVFRCSMWLLRQPVVRRECG